TVSGGTTPYDYLWNEGQTTEDLSDIGQGTYIVTVTDANLCTITDTVTITEPSAIITSITGTDILCNGDCDGTADLTVAGGTPGYSYTWNYGDTTEDLSNLCAGIYCVTVTDANSCISSVCVTITEPAGLFANIIGTDVLCNGDSNGIADLVVNGGILQYSYLWNTGATSEDLYNIPQGFYVVTVTDADRSGT
ncbi:unnamed protein product, partial [marine sediment metagenome]